MEKQLELKLENRNKTKMNRAEQLEYKMDRISQHLGARIEPNKWYGTCYGKDLDLDMGLSLA